jgi:hypothetical protein
MLTPSRLEYEPKSCAIWGNYFFPRPLLNYPDVAIYVALLFDTVQLLFKVHAVGPEILDLPFLQRVDMGIVIIKNGLVAGFGHLFQQKAEFPGGFIIITDIQGFGDDVTDQLFYFPGFFRVFKNGFFRNIQGLYPPAGKFFHGGDGNIAHTKPRVNQKTKK